MQMDLKEEFVSFSIEKVLHSQYFVPYNGLQPLINLQYAPVW